MLYITATAAQLVGSVLDAVCSHARHFLKGVLEESLVVLPTFSKKFPAE